MSFISLEPPPQLAVDGLDDEPFARPARLKDVDEQGLPVFTRDDPDKGISERLMRIWQERGDFSQVTAASIRAGESEIKEGDAEDAKDQDARPSAQEMRDLQSALMEQLAFARGELATALDLLSVLAPLTDPPTVDVNALPLPPQTLTIVPTIPPPSFQPPTGIATPSTSSAADDATPSAHLPLATSLASLRSSANAFFAAADTLLPPSTPSAGPSTRPPSPWPSLLHLRSSLALSLIPLGASRGASLSGKNETRAARTVGVFFGCEEAKEGWRRGAVARVEDLTGKKGEQRGRLMVLTLKMDGSEEERVVWGLESETSGGAATGVNQMERTLEARGRTAFAEELFAVLSNEGRSDPSLKARLALGKRSEGDSVVTEGHGWTLTITMVSAPSSKLTPSPTSPNASALLPLLRLLFLQEYAQRRASPLTSPWSRPLLQTLSAALSHTYRLRSLVTILETAKSTLAEAGLARSDVSFYGAASNKPRGTEVVQEDAGEAVLRIIRGEKELGGRAVLRATKTATFHISFSSLLPTSPHAPSIVAAHQPLVLQSPGSVPVAIASVQHLRDFLEEQVRGLIKAEQKKEKMKKEKV